MRIIKHKIFYTRLFFLSFLLLPIKMHAVVDIFFPTNNYVTPSSVINIKWNTMSSFNNYELQVGNNLDFSSLFFSITVNNNNTSVSGLTSGATYYLRVRGKETGVTSEWSPTIQFKRFTPSDLPNQQLWLSADAGITQAGGSISAWNDQSAKANHALQASPTLMPQFIATEPLLNGKPTVKLDGADDFLQFNEIANSRSIFIVLKHTTGNQSFASLLGHSADLDITSGDGTAFFVDPGFFNAKIAGGEIRINTKPPPPNLSLMLKPTKYTLYRFITTSNVRVDHIASDRKVPGRYWNGNYAEMIIYSDTLNSNNRDLVEDYLLNKYAPRISIKDTVIGSSFCTPVVIAAPNNYTNYTWSTGATTSSVSVTPNKIYSLKTKDIFDIESTTYINVFPYRRLGNKTVYLCQGDTFKVDLKTPVGFTAVWLPSNISNTKFNITQSGQYVVKITDNGGCFVYDTINAIIDNPQLSPVPDAFDSLRVCLNEKIFLNTATSFDSIRWSTGSTNTFISVTAPGTYTVFGRTTTGCIISKTFKVKVNGEAPVAKFDYSNVCQNAATLFTDSSTHSVASVITNWKWTFGDGNTSLTQNSSNTYSGLGTYTVGFKITTNQGCFDSISKTILVNKRPEPSFYNLLSCAGIPTTFVDQSIANSASITNWNWNFAGLEAISGINNPSFKFPSDGNYNVQLSVTNSNGCIKDTTIVTTVEVAPIADFSYDSVCGITPVTFKFLGTVAPPNTIPNLSWGKWDFGDNQIETAIKSPQHVYSSPGTYDVSLIVNSSNQCVDTVVKQVKVFDFPVVDFDVSQTQCVGKEIQFTDISATPDGTPVTSWNWFFSGQYTSADQNPRYTFNSEGNYIIQLTAKNAVGCIGTKLRSIAVSALPTPKFIFSPQNGLPPLCVTYTNQSPVSGNYLWSYGDSGLLIEGYNPPQHCYSAIGTYPIKLIATDFRGCTDTLTKFILVDKAYLDGVMTSISITPNGDYYKIQATVTNNSNIEITALGLSLQLGGGAVIRENWTGSLLPGKTVVYLFTGEIKLSETSQIPVVCASIDNINNNAFEDRTDNNTTCKEVKVGSFDVFNIYPNPAFENVNFGVMLPKDGRVVIRFIDMLGQLMYNKDFDGLKGYNSFQMSTMPLNAAVYVAEIYYDGQVIRKKFMRKDRK